MDEHHWSEDHLIASTAVLAGEIMLISGAEIARIEEPYIIYWGAAMTEMHRPWYSAQAFL